MKPTKTKLKITSKEDYPVLEGFPRTLQKLIVSNLHVSQFLQHLTRPTSL